MRVQAVGGQWHEEHRAGVKRQGELRGKDIPDAVFSRILEPEAELGQPAGILHAVVEGVFGPGSQLVEPVIEGAERHDAVGGHVLGLVGMGRDLRLDCLRSLVAAVLW